LQTSTISQSTKKLSAPGNSTSKLVAKLPMTGKATSSAKPTLFGTKTDDDWETF